MRILVECCQTNIANGTDQVIERIKEKPSVELLDYGCLGFCGLCAKERFVLINGNYFGRTTAEQLFKAFEQYVEQR